MKSLSDIDRLNTVAGLREIVAKLFVEAESPWKLKRRLLDLAGRLPIHGWNRLTHDPEIVGERIGIDAFAYHVDCLTNLDWDQTFFRRKVRYHLLLAGASLDPIEPTFAPLVSIVIAVLDGHDSIRRTVESACAQTYPAVEIIVVDAGSTDGTSAVVGSISGPVHLIQTDDANLAAARNQGIAKSNGDFIHFLEAGDELLPSAIADKLRAWQECPDARLCYTPYEELRAGGTEEVIGPKQQEDVNDFRSPVGDAMLAASSRFPFTFSTVMVPRWFIDQVGPLDEDMESSEDSRYWFRMARQGLKAVALRTPQTRCHVAATKDSKRSVLGALEADLRSAEDLADQPRLYRYIVCLLARATWLLDKAFDEDISHDLIENYHRRFMDLEARFGRGQASGEGVTGLLLDQLVFMLRQKQRFTEDATRPMLRLWHEREDQLLERINRISYVTGSDLRRWLPDLPPRPYADLRRSEQIALKFALEQLQVSLVLGELPIRFRSLERVAADYPGHPYERYWNGAFRLAHLLGDDTARTVVRQKLYRSGWQFLGRAKKALQPRDTA